MTDPFRYDGRMRGKHQANEVRQFDTYGMRLCPTCGCLGSFGTCHCDHDIYGPECYVGRGRHEQERQP